MPDFLLELRTEEIPARMQAGARRDLEKLFREHMAATGVTHGAITVWSTPRRLALIARGLPEATEAQREEIKGPRVGAPPQALEGFLRKVGLPQEQLEDRGGTYFAIIERPGRATCDVLAWAIAAIVRTFPWPKAMRWGAASVSTESPRWVRPLSGIVAILGDELVECTAAGVASGYATLGHRFHAPGPITIGGAGDYREKLRACHVIVDHAEREALIRDKAKAAAAQAGLVLVEDEGLVIENAGLTEWPVPLLGRFDAAFLEVPPEVIQLTARTNQKYFVCKSSPSKFGEDQLLANAFVCTANIEAADGGAAIVDGNRKVLAARLSDARFFWEQDRRKTLAQHAEKLSNIVFHEKLGTVADKVERLAKLARWLVEEGIVKSSPDRGGGSPLGLTEGSRPTANAAPSGEAGPLRPFGAPPRAGEDLASLAEQAARLCKADLVTEMVGEFPELQGLMGGYYARAEGLPDQVADAIRDHYKPVGQGDDVPTAPVTVAVSLADKLDTLICFFAIKERPTGSKDPYALRRAMLGVIETITQSNLRVGVRDIVRESFRTFAVGIAGSRFVIWNDLEKDANWSPLLGNDAAFADGVGDMLVLKDEPSISSAEIGNRGISVWDASYLRARNLVDFEVSGFSEAVNDVVEFCFDRLRDREKRAGRRPDLISAVLPRDIRNVLEGLGIGDEWVKLPNTTSNDDTVRILKLGALLEGFLKTEDGANLLAGYKRAANILKKENYAGGAENLLSYTPEPAERALMEALDAAEPKARDAIAAEEFGAAMGALASLRGPIDAFFDTVTVNDEDLAKRAYRLGLLARFRGAVHRVADFSKIEG